MLKEKKNSTTYKEMIESSIMKKEVNVLIDAREMYKEFADIPEATFYKVLERLKNSGKLAHLSTGIYYRPANSRFGIVPIQEGSVTNHYTRESRGMLIGYQLYNKRGLTTQISKKTEVLSNALKENSKKIENVLVKKTPIKFDKKVINTVEMLEILQNCEKIEDLNQTAFATYMRDNIFKYSEKSTIYVLNNMKYKKSTIASLVKFLEYFGINNTLRTYLSQLSSYNTPDVEELYEITQV